MKAGLMLPRSRIIVPKPPSRIKLDMAFGVGAGTSLFDKSRYRSHGTISGADWATGLHGYCLDFNEAIPDYVSIPAAYTQLNFTSEKFSIVARVKFDKLTSYDYICERGLFNKDGYYFLATPDDAIAIVTNQSTSYQISQTANGSLTVATWHTLGVSRNGASVRLYIDGVDATSVAGTHTDPKTSSRTFNLGVAEDLTSNPLDGKMEFLRVFGGIALSTAEHLAYHRCLT